MIEIAVEMLVERKMVTLVLAHPVSKLVIDPEIFHTPMDAVMFALLYLAGAMNVAVAAYDQNDLVPLPVLDVATLIKSLIIRSSMTCL
jgi:hypothetical protein